MGGRRTRLGDRAKGVDVRLAEADSQRVDVPLITKSELTTTLQKLGLE
jgi:hypothetical protein